MALRARLGRVWVWLLEGNMRTPFGRRALQTTLGLRGTVHRGLVTKMQLCQRGAPTRVACARSEGVGQAQSGSGPNPIANGAKAIEEAFEGPQVQRARRRRRECCEGHPIMTIHVLSEHRILQNLRGFSPVSQHNDGGAYDVSLQ